MFRPFLGAETCSTPYYAIKLVVLDENTYC